MLLMDCVSLADIVIGFRSSFYNKEGDEIKTGCGMARHYLYSKRFKLDLLHFLPFNYLALRNRTSLGMLMISLKSFKFLYFFLSNHYKFLIGIEKNKFIKLSFLFFSLSFIMFFCSYIWITLTAWSDWIPPLFF